MKERRSLVTGGTGWLGQHLCKSLAEKGHKVFSFSKNPRELSEPMITHIRGSVEDKDEWVSALRISNPTWIFHLAWDRSLSRRSHDGISSASTTLEFMLTTIPSTCEAFIYVSTLAEYGSIPTPFLENDDPRPCSAYGKAKYACTQVALQFTSRHPMVVLRLSVLYGDSPRDDTFFGGLARVLSGDQAVLEVSDLSITRDFLHIDDAVRAMIVAAENIQSCQGHIINVCSGEERSLGDVIKLVESISGRKIVANITGASSADQFRYVGSAAKLGKLLNFSSTVPFEQGIAKFISNSMTFDP